MLTPWLLYAQRKQDYGDLESLYELNRGDQYPNIYYDGWNLIRIYSGGSDDNIIEVNAIFLYQVGSKKTEWGIIIQCSRQSMKLLSPIPQIRSLDFLIDLKKVHIIVCSLKFMIVEISTFILPRILTTMVAGL